MTRQLLLLAWLFPLVARAANPGEDLYTSKVRPILASRCFKCHGPDEGSRKAKLRLDTRDTALAPARSGKRAIVPGKPADSELIARIHSEDETEVMPPPGTKLTLSASEKEILRTWISQGAPFTQHWSFVAPRRPIPPRVQQTTWPINPIDALVLARLEKAGLAPSAEADRYILVRRVYLDLIGLPPTPAEADAFVNDPHPDAYTRLVDRLLASPAYGERWARRWLDLARYADTNGYEKDRTRSIWPWRDWVIASLNEDMPFDQFTTWQLAGDLVPGAGLAGRIATGFHRNTMLNEEGGIDPLEFRYHAMTDRVATTGTVWLGLTVGCAQCHTHKYDPLSHREYFQLFAFLNNADEPQLTVPDPAVESRRTAIQAEIKRREAQLVDQFPVKEDPSKKDSRPLAERRREALEARYAEWRRDALAQVSSWQELRPSKLRGSLPLLTQEADGSIFVSGDMSKSDFYDLWFDGDFAGVTALRIEALPDERLPSGGPGRVYYEGPQGDFFLSELSLKADDKPVRVAGASESFASGASTAAKALDGDQQTGWSISGKQGQAHQAIFRLDRPLGPTKQLSLRLLFERYYAAGLGRFRVSVTRETKPIQAQHQPAELARLLRDSADSPALRRAFLLAIPELAKARASIEELRKTLPASPTTLVMQERPATNPRKTHIHHRGEFLQPGDSVVAGVPDMLPAFPQDAPRNRLGLARWLLARDNPLTARVTVNREWAAFFGQGIVPTLGDFGLQGELPSHPEVLDWLAVEFQETGWSLKHLHRLIVTSATYRQSSRVTPEGLKRDPQNRLLSRGPRVRLEAELVRDLVLRASGQLAMKLGGPSVFPPQPPEVTQEGTYGRLDWKVSTGADRFRRGLYTFMKRTSPYALFGTFDGPSGEVCVARREVSNTPLQALTLLNDQTILEAARALGTTLAEDRGDIKDRVRLLFRRILTRPPTEQELTLLTKFYLEQKARFDRKDLDPQSLADAGPRREERAAWAALARVLFNLDETITRG